MNQVAGSLITLKWLISQKPHNRSACRQQRENPLNEEFDKDHVSCAIWELYIDSGF